MKVLIIDNYDSFTYNLVHIVQNILNEKVDVIRNDKLDLNHIATYDKIILSPGPGVPDDAGMLKAVIKKYAPSKSILGVCLGLQAIAEVFEANLYNLSDVYHGVATKIQIKKSDSLFEDLTEDFYAGRYHSWVVSNKNLPDVLEITAIDSENHIMAIRHKKYDVKGVQFHPESVLTENGEQIIRNFLKINWYDQIKFPSYESKDFALNKLSSNLLFC